MKCPKCQAENPETSQFCADCGTRIRGYVPDSQKSGTSRLNSHDVRPEVTETLQTPINELSTGATFALVYLGLGDKEEALEWLGKACDDEDEKADVKFSNFKSDFRWDGLRSDPRFKTLLKKLHLE